MMSKHSVAVRIAGHQYKIRSDGDPVGLREIAGYVDRAMDRVRERTGTVDTLDVAVLTCLNLAREILALRDQTAGASVDQEKLRGLIGRVEAALGDAAPIAGVDAASEVTSDSATETAEAAADAKDSARTLDLPSVESLRDRTEGASTVTGEAMPETRVAVGGGRDRAS